MRNAKPQLVCVCVCLRRLSKELQQKDQIIESLQARLNQHQHPPRPDTPCSSHALSDATDQLDRISYVSEDRGSTAEDLELCSEVEAASELHQKGTGERPTLLFFCRLDLQADLTLQELAS